MSPVGHLQYGWWFAHWAKFDRRERAAIALAGAAADRDGLSLFAGSDAYYHYHHILFHNVGTLLAVIPLAGILFWRRPLAWLMTVFAFGMHIVEDYFTVPWDMLPWRPFSPVVTNLGRHVNPEIVQHVLQYAAMLGVTAITVWIYLRYRRTPLEIISPSLDELILGYAILPWRNHCAECSSRAHFRCEKCGRTFCARHSSVGPSCRVRCAVCAVRTG